MQNAYVSDANTAAREAIASEVRALMGRHRVSQTGLAAVLGMSQSALSRRLNAEQPFDADELLAIARFFKVNVTQLLSEATRLLLKVAA